MSVCALYTNGMNTTIGAADGIRRLIEEKAKIPTRLIYNDATTPEATQKLAGDTALGLTTGLCAVAGAIATVTSAIIAPPLAPLALAATGGHLGLFSNGRTQHQAHLSRIQSNKVMVARRIEASVRDFFRNGGRHLMLIGHSQGAHVLHLALSCLKNFKDRISVITIGGLVPVCPHKAKDVINLVNNGDWVAWSTPAYQKITLEGLAPDSLPSCTHRTRRYTPYTEHLGHGAIDYLRNPEFLATLRQMISNVA